MRVAFFGGSFDPPHYGHLAVARAARTALGLDTILFAPVGAQPLKPQGSTASFEDRTVMVRLAIAGETGFAVSLLDAPKPFDAPNFTLDTLLRLRAELTGGGELFCLMGADSFLGFRRWHRSTEIPFVAPLIVASRPGQPLDDLRAALPDGLTMESAFASSSSGDRLPASSVEVRTLLLRSLAGEASPFYVLPGLNVEVSASEIRDRIREEAFASPASEQQLLPIPVLDYIRLRGLYG